MDDNTFSGTLGASDSGLLLTAAAGQTMRLLATDNTATSNTTVGMSIVAEAGSTINADDPNGTVPTGITGNTANDNGSGLKSKLVPEQRSMLSSTTTLLSETPSTGFR